MSGLLAGIPILLEDNVHSLYRLLSLRICDPIDGQDSAAFALNIDDSMARTRIKLIVCGKYFRKRNRDHCFIIITIQDIAFQNNQLLGDSGYPEG